MLGQQDRRDAIASAVLFLNEIQSSYKDLFDTDLTAGIYQFKDIFNKLPMRQSFTAGNISPTREAIANVEAESTSPRPQKSEALNNHAISHRIPNTEIQLNGNKSKEIDSTLPAIKELPTTNIESAMTSGTTAVCSEVIDLLTPPDNVNDTTYLSPLVEQVSIRLPVSKRIDGDAFNSNVNGVHKKLELPASAIPVPAAMPCEDLPSGIPPLQSSRFINNKKPSPQGAMPFVDMGTAIVVSNDGCSVRDGMDIDSSNTIVK